MHRLALRLLAIAASLALVVSTSPSAAARDAHDGDDGGYAQTNLVSDIAGLAPVFDPNLKNPWGLVHGPTTPWWISDNNAGVSTLYTGAGAPVPLQGPPTVTDLHNEVIIPPPSNAAPGTLATPTGIVFNSTSDFVVSSNGVSAPAAFIFATEDGTLSGWSPKVNRQAAILTVDNTDPTNGPVYKGLAMASDDGHNQLFATNFRFGTIDVFDAHFKRVNQPGTFVDRHLPAHFAPFGIRLIGGLLYVTYAEQNAARHDDVSGPGNGFVDVFTVDGRLVRRLIERGQLNSPWGLVLTPEGFGPLGGSLFVGNFGDGTIHAYDLESGRLRGTVRDAHGQPIVIDDLWGLDFGNGAAAGSATTLFFTAGINDENDGLFGTLSPTAAAEAGGH